MDENHNDPPLMTTTRDCFDAIESVTLSDNEGTTTIGRRELLDMWRWYQRAKEVIRL